MQPTNHQVLEPLKGIISDKEKEKKKKKLWTSIMLALDPIISSFFLVSCPSLYLLTLTLVIIILGRR